MFQENSGIAIVFPSWRLREILELRELRERLDELSKLDAKAKQCAA
jgi:hypothetical protein